MIDSSVLGFYKVKRTMGCHSCGKKMQKDDRYLKVELGTNRRNYCEDCFEEWWNVVKEGVQRHV